MTDYIDRQAAIKAIDDLPNCYKGYSDAYDKACIIGVLEELPPAEVEPVKRGRWIIRSHKMMGECPCCSECGSFNPIEYRYCPNCGAKMFNEKEGEEE